MEGCFTFQWGGDCIFKWSVHPMGGISFDWRFSKKIIGWGGVCVPPSCPPPTMGNPAYYHIKCVSAATIPLQRFQGNT